ncbi:lysophospholipid acyltransferase family protein [Bosea eneae]|uniref:Lysophospholipid acyltransferase family protein n=1 Tax=Bosea eneae TaxID=151454 RepID=A0ABW0IRL1_9HYPH
MRFGTGQSASFAGRALHRYLDFVRRTTRFKPAIPGARPWERSRDPFIALTWHGQQMLSLAALDGAAEVAILASLHFDGAVVASVVERAGFRVIRGSGTQSPLKIKAKRAIPAFFEMREALRAGTSLLLTADVPKIARVAGRGAVQLARATGRPIYLFAAVTSARIDLDNWDRASIALPFGRGCVLWSEPLYVRKAADEREMGLIALEIASQLDELHVTAHRLLDRRR